ncbi:tyrosinase family protein [Marinoscillum furvescens]|uniref:Tyrosinase n=1 Tax=Marinoscillum furvescens DSM 4134 TaxID=1122208 RepID=A0A3D9L4M1_MARFU|nr:tyrosinase family protein [Marinoscillum furvescens]RED97890.1 tyrosinase [Marinoscillum furvescens DSM 4134]
MAKKKQRSRYEQVRLILEKAQGKDCPDYDGYHRFWDRPYEEFISMKLYGIPMFVLGENPNEQPPSHSCCHSSAQPVAKSTTAATTTGDPEASGLIRGLKGKFPFDGTQFPKLLWSAEREVSAPDIQLIADWIADGCPQEDTTDSLDQVERQQLATGKATFGVCTATTNQKRRSNGHLAQRKNVEELSESELNCYRDALRIVKSRPEQDRRSFAYWGRVHGNSCQHGWEKFLPWHRCQMYEMEQLLMDEDESVALHYWQWSNKHYLDPDTGDYFIPEAYQLWITEEAISKLEARDFPSDLADVLRKHTDKPFQTLDDLCYAAFYPSKKLDYYAVIKPWKQQFYDLLEDINPLWYPYRYPMKTNYDPKRYPTPLRTLRDFHHHYPTRTDIEQILATRSFQQFGGGDAYNESFGVLDMDPHNTIHIWSGGYNPNYDPNDPLEPKYGDMLNNLTAGFDPIFYAHHANVDRMWYKWQVKHPGLTPDGGNSVLVPFNYLVGETYNIHRFGYEYVRSGHYMQGNKELGIRKLKTDKVNVSHTALEHHEKAEVKLINVTQPNQSLFVKVFLNLDSPEPGDRDKHPDHYVGSFVLFGHGQCIGSSGHCDPPGRRRVGDVRERHHNTPWNYRLDATQCVSKLIEQGEKDFHVNLLVQDTDGEALTDLLRMEALSLDFID